MLDDYSRGYIFCELTTETTANHTVRCLIRAMRRWKVIPKALLFDNGAEFKGLLLKTFCENLGIRIIYSTPRHPQTNGKLERAFRDDRRDFYSSRDNWSVEKLQQHMPEYVYYRNYQRGHFALNGKQASSRFCQQDRSALPSVLDRLEEYAQAEVMKRMVNNDGYVRIFSKLIYVGIEFRESAVNCVETIDGLDIRKDGLAIGLLREYYLYRTLCARFHADEIPEEIVLHQPRQYHYNHPRMAVAP